MSFTAGNFTASDLHGEVLAKIDALVVDTTKKHLINETSIINELFSHPTFSAKNAEQAAFFSDARRCANLKLSWLLDGDTADPQAVGTNPFCNQDGPLIGSDSVTYAKPGGKEKAFKVLTDVCHNLYDYADRVAYAFLSKRSILVNQLEKDAVAFLVANGDNLTGVPVPKGGVTGAIWNIGAVPANGGAEAVKDLVHIGHFAQDQRMIAPVQFAGSRFRYEDAVFRATAGGGTSDVRSLLTGGIPIIRDTFNLDVATTTQDIFIVDKATVGYVNYTWAKSTQAPSEKMPLNEPMTFYINDPVIKVWDPVGMKVVPYKWDITMTRKCHATNQFSIVYNIAGRGGFLRAPKDVTNKPQIVQVKFADN